MLARFGAGRTVRSVLPLVHAMLEAIPTATMVLSRAGAVRAVNSPAIALLGVNPDLTMARDAVVRGEVPAVWSCECPDRDGNKRWVLFRLTALELEGVEPLVVLTANDVTWERAAERELEQLRIVDLVTGLPNERQLDSYLGRALERHRRHPDRLAAMHIELTGLDEIAAEHGLGEVDDLLADVAGRLHLAIRSGDFIASIGRGVFVVLVERERAGGASSGRRTNRRESADIEIAAARVAAMLGEPYEVAMAGATAGATIGVDVRLAVASAQDDVESLLRRAAEDSYRTERDARRAHLRLTT